MTTISHCPKVIRHDFPDEMMNYIDEKMDEGQYRKRFRYDRPDKMMKVGKHSTSILNMNSQDIFEKIFKLKKEPKSDQFTIKPRYKVNKTPIHKALLKVKHQKEVIEDQLALADKQKQCNNENDICMLANQGAINYILSQNLELPEEHPETRRAKHSMIPKPKSVKMVQLNDDPQPLSVEGRAYSLAVSQFIKSRPFSSQQRCNSAYSTMRPLTGNTLRSTKNFSERGASEVLLSNYTDLRNQIFEQVRENVNEQDEEHIDIQIGYPSYLTPSNSMLGLRGGKVPPGFMPKGLKRIHSAATANVEIRAVISPGEQLFQDEVKKKNRPQTAILSKVPSKLAVDHLTIIQEMKHQEDITILKQSFNDSFREQQQSLHIKGDIKKRIQSAHPSKMR